MSDDTGVRVSKEAGIARVTLCRPGKRNAFDDKLIDALFAVFADLAQDADVRAVILEGEGKVFSAGADLEWMKRMVTADRQSNIDDAMKLADLFELIHVLPKAVIAKVQGAALGGGAGLVAAADIAVVAEGTKLGFTEARLGILPAVISPYVILKIGAGQARRWFVTGQRMDAQEALRIGLVHQVVPAADLDQAAQAMAFEVLQCGPRAVGLSKELVEEVTGGLALALASEDGFEAVKHYTAQQIAEARVSEEGQEGLRAFLDKRKPRWAQ
jgi:methylglutaconyl-CoA hydratase